ncbi:hypothetical protein Tco_1549088 [Tanacetum coccineum]
MEYLVKISKKARILELKRRHLKIIVLTSYTPYPSRKIQHICACTSLKTTKEQGSIRRKRLTKKEITMAKPNEYISVTRKNFLADDNKGRMVEKGFLEIQGTFLVKIRDNTFNGIIGGNAFKHIDNFLEVVGPLKIKGLSQDRFRLSVFPISLAGIKTYEEYELNNNMTGDLEEPCSDINGFCNGGELPGMVRVECMTYFQNHKWYDELTDGKLKEEALMHKARFEESWGDATPRLNAHENAPFARWENHGRGTYANAKAEKDYDPYLDINCIFGKNYETNNVGNTQDNKKEHHDPSICNIRRFEMMKYSIDADD